MTAADKNETQVAAPDDSTAQTRALARQVIVLPPEAATHPYTDPVLLTLADKDQPQPEVICRHCYSAIWMTTHNQAKCYCQVTRAFCWTTAEPIPTTRCTGYLRAVAEMQAALADK